MRTPPEPRCRGQVRSRGRSRKAEHGASLGPLLRRHACFGGGELAPETRPGFLALLVGRLTDRVILPLFHTTSLKEQVFDRTPGNPIEVRSIMGRNLGDDLALAPPPPAA